MELTAASPASLLPVLMIVIDPKTRDSVTMTSQGMREGAERGRQIDTRSATFRLAR